MKKLLIVIAAISLMLLPALKTDASLIINEVLADPASDAAGDANLDGVRHSTDDEFVEIVNISALNVDLTDWYIRDGQATRHYFSAGTVLQPFSPILIFGGGNPTFDGTSVVITQVVNNLPPSVIIQTASTGGLSLNNSGDTISLFDQTSALIDSFTYGPEGGNDQSLTLDPDITGLAHVLHSTSTGSEGDLFSPGTMTDKSDFSTPVPIPGTVWVLGSSLFSLIGLRRKRK